MIIFLHVLYILYIFSLLHKVFLGKDLKNKDVSSKLKIFSDPYFSKIPFNFVKNSTAACVSVDFDSPDVVLKDKLYRF